MQSSVFPVAFPPRAPDEPPPQWTGDGFMIGGELQPIAEYSSDLRGWDDALTDIHEEVTGSSHPIDIASRATALRSLARYLDDPAGTILEIGCSSGYLLPLIRHRFPRAAILGADVVKQPLLRLARRIPDLPLLRFDLTRCPLPEGCIDAVVMLNVLEHIGNDGLALAHVHRILKPGGIVVIEVPAGPSLYDHYDERLRHYRRYDQRGLTSACRAAQLDPVDASHLGVLIYPAFWISKKINRRYRPKGAQEVERLVKRQISATGTSSLLKFAMRLEALVAARLGVRYPFGVRCTGVYRKPRTA